MLFFFACLFFSVYLFLFLNQSLVALMKTVVELCHEFTTIILSYEERSTGNKAEIEKKFFQVSVIWYGSSKLQVYQSIKFSIFVRMISIVD